MRDEPYAYRVEGGSPESMELFFRNPFYYSKPRRIGRDEEFRNWACPEGRGLAGVWFFRTEAAAISMRPVFACRPRFLSRIALAALEGEIVQDNLIGPLARIAVRDYALAGCETSGNFVTSLTVPDAAVEVWTGDGWTPKRAVDRDRLRRTLDRNRYALPR